MIDFHFKNIAGTTGFIFRTDGAVLSAGYVTIMDITETDATESNLIGQQFYEGQAVTTAQLVAFATTNSLYLIAVNRGGADAYTVLYQPTLAAPTFNTVTTTSMNVVAPALSGQILGYQLDRSTNSSFTANLVTTTSTSATIAQTGLTTGTTYYYRLRQIWSDGVVGLNGTTGSQATS
jgi:hypothetical protein